MGQKLTHDPCLVLPLDALGNPSRLRIAITESAIIERFKEKGLNGNVKIAGSLNSAAIESSSKRIMFI